MSKHQYAINDLHDINQHLVVKTRTICPAGPITGWQQRRTKDRKKPAMYKVIMLNDDYTPMEFVVMVLPAFFPEVAGRCNTDHASCASARCWCLWCLYTLKSAEMKATQVMELARKNQHPLQLQIEKE